MTIATEAVPEMFARSARIVRDRVKPLPGTITSPRTVALMQVVDKAVDHVAPQSEEHDRLLLRLAEIVEQCDDVQEAARLVADALVEYAIEAVKRVPIMPLCLVDDEVALDLLTGRGFQ